MNSSRVQLPHLRVFVAHWPDPWSQGDSQARPQCLPVPPISSAAMARTASAAQLREPSASLPCLLNSAAGFIDQALLPESARTGNSCYGPLARALRPFAPARSASVAHFPSAHACLSGANRLTCLADPHPGRSFVPPLPCPATRLRADRFSVFTVLDPSCGGPGDHPRSPWEYLPGPTGHSDLQGHFPRSNDRQDSTFPRESAGRVAFAIFPPVFRVSGTLQRAFASFFHRIRFQHSTP